MYVFFTSYAMALILIYCIKFSVRFDSSVNESWIAGYPDPAYPSQSLPSECNSGYG